MWLCKANGGKEACMPVSETCCVSVSFESEAQCLGLMVINYPIYNEA